MVLAGCGDGNGEDAGNGKDATKPWWEDEVALGDGRRIRLIYRAYAVKAALDAGADVDAKDDEGNTALMDAASGGWRSEDVIKLLLDAGADVDAKDDEGNTALMDAASGGWRNEDVVKVLLDAGADVDAEGRPRRNRAYECCIRQRCGCDQVAA